MSGHLGKQHSSVTLERRCRSASRAHVRFQYAPRARPPSALHLATPERAPVIEAPDGLPAGGIRFVLRSVLAAWIALTGVHAAVAASLPDALVADLVGIDDDARRAAVSVLAAQGGAEALQALRALREGSLGVWADPDGSARAVITGTAAPSESGDVAPLRDLGGEPLRGPDGQALTVPRTSVRMVEADRALRRAVKAAIDRVELLSGDAKTRESAAGRLGREGGAEVVAVLAEALAREADRTVRRAIDEALQVARLSDSDPAVQAGAVERLGLLHGAGALDQLKALKSSNDPAVAKAADAAVRRIERWGMMTRGIEIVFSGLSLSSILLLMALGLAIVFGLMGVINMAHGELMMLGAYTAFVVQEVFVSSVAPSARDYYFVVAIPAAFCVAGIVGLALEQSVIRFLYGRPLETLLATWGVSLILQQAARQVFGAANVDVASPAWLSGGLAIVEGVRLPYNRLFIIGFTAVCVAAVYLVLFRSPAGLKIRAVTQNREMSACLGVRTRRVDTWTFALGAGLAGMAGCALTLIGNVGPDLGQHYIVESFMVVVAGGVGKLAGTVAAALGIGGLDKVLEPALGAVYGKVLILGALILFLQRRPSGLFPAKGRHVDV